MGANYTARDRTLSAILAAASRIVAERGSNVSMHEIAEYAGVGRATLYRYFSTREELTVKLFESAVEDATQIVDSVELSKLPIRQAIERLALEILSFADTHRAIIMDDAVAGLRHQAKDVIGARVEELFKTRLEAGELVSGLAPAILAKYFGALMRTASSMVAEEDRDRVTVSAEVAEFLCAGIRAKD